MTAEQRLLDVIERGITGALACCGGSARPEPVLAALREAIAEDPALLEGLQGERVALIADQNGDAHRWFKLGRAVEATHQRERGWLANGVVIPGWNDCLDAIYTAADVERSS